MTLGGFREQIDQIDDDIVDLLGRRLELVRQVARAKKATAIPVMQPERVLEVKRRCKERGQSHNLRADFVEGLYQFIIDEACRVEDDFVGAAKEPTSRAAFRRADVTKMVSE